MTPYERLYIETAEARERFLSIPLVRQALSAGGPRELYIAFLTRPITTSNTLFRFLRSRQRARVTRSIKRRSPST